MSCPDAYVDRTDLRQRLAAHRLDQRLVLRIGAWRISDRSIAWVRGKYHFDALRHSLS